MKSSSFFLAVRHDTNGYSKNKTLTNVSYQENGENELICLCVRVREFMVYVYCMMEVKNDVIAFSFLFRLFRTSFSDIEEFYRGANGFDYRSRRLLDDKIQSEEF